MTRTQFAAGAAVDKDMLWWVAVDYVEAHISTLVPCEVEEGMVGWLWVR